MSDIFLSYAEEDRGIAEQLSAELTARGWSVWWDRKIRLGHAFDGEIERALADARCVIVLWSHASVGSDWVNTEASEGKARGVLLPVIIEDVRPPLEFRRLQTARLVDWPQWQHPTFDRLLREIAAHLETPAAPVDAPLPARRKRLRLALALLPTAVLALLAALLPFWRVPTHVRLRIAAERAELTLAGANAPLMRIFDAISFPAIAVERFATVTFEAEKIESADPARYLLAEDRYPESAWRTAPSNGGIIEYRARQDRSLPSLTISRHARDGSVLGTLWPINVPTLSKVTLEIIGDRSRSVTLILENTDPVLKLPLSGVIEVTASDTLVSHLAEANPPDQATTWRLELRRGGAPAEIRGRSGLLIASLTLSTVPQSQRVSLFSNGGIAIGAIDFSRQDALGQRVSSVIDGVLSYPGKRGAAPVTLEATDFVALRALEQSYISGIFVEEGRRGMQLDLEGIAGHVSTERASVRSDRRLTAFDVVAGERTWLVLGVLAWLAPTLGAVYSLLAHNKGGMDPRV